jgi:DNA repair protein RecN (Recombination protein N)
MLTHLQIRDFAIVVHLELDLTSGMSAVTGETGAGKSIMIDALGLLLGDRADSTVVRQGAERADISATFDLGHLPDLRNWLAERELGGAGEECHLRRVISYNGRSRAYIDGSPQPVQLLRDFGERLVDIHGQHEHQSLFKRDMQRQLLDDYGDNQSLLTELANQYRQWRQIDQRLQTLRQNSHEKAAQRDLLHYQVRELQALNLSENELPELEAEHVRLANAGRLLASCQRAVTQLYESDEFSVQKLLGQVLDEITALSDLDPQLVSAGELLNGALIQVGEASDELRRYLQRIELDPGRLAWVEERLVDIQTLARKHRLEPEGLPDLLKRLQGELDELENVEYHEEALQKRLAEAWQDYQQSAKTLSKRRATHAAELAKRVSEAMQDLGMQGGRFEISLMQQDRPTLQGLETVEFLVSANPGQPLKSLAKVASGGELSRISLAIQVIAARSALIPTLIFDEVDVGIGGGVAEVVGRQLRALGETRQVLCVTHLPQVAAQAHHHLKVSKHTDGQSTYTVIDPLESQARIEEIARMLGGVELTANTWAHAEEMIAIAGSHTQGSKG